ncbi:hypothetical protein TNCV_4647451 [Trichonephila clavipes]|uniref:Uncharacterized protein n=1 Tax=Trichonephila clavipes TaxID=2585209 RepID=A0A8X6SXS6_TRICX|nr:hypothetical protein TNCV_4647451 [Trichonephila clavipes]
MQVTVRFSYVLSTFEEEYLGHRQGISYLSSNLSRRLLGRRIFRMSLCPTCTIHLQTPTPILRDILRHGPTGPKPRALTTVGGLVSFSNQH